MNTETTAALDRIEDCRIDVRRAKTGLSITGTLLVAFVALNVWGFYHDLTADYSTRNDYNQLVVTALIFGLVSLIATGICTAWVCGSRDDLRMAERAYRDVLAKEAA
ncbi:hypothetical protein SEA_BRUTONGASTER_88 [Gordonia phage BrutonGaster]|uniref:Uncharacterized protein n=1 Tax=Gordonia phage BrutonGaster TaxID=2530116 RepID=A0A482JKK1_9CAUD|nr:hypothetical protein HOV26_gp094 [Gordonia phage BrutonGaster]QBP33303.1 hypothetical protein SEA_BRUTONGASTER_88 [Gordonia phage BrutonGaster]